MKLAFISDIHGNLAALEATLADVAGRGFEGLYHLGDLVGYGPWPNEVVARIRSAAIPGIQGNYDSTVAAGYEHCGCQYDDPREQALSTVSFEWTRAQLSDHNRSWLATLPFRLDLRPAGGHVKGLTLTLIHGGATLNTVYWREDRSDDFCRRMTARLGAQEGDVILFGHTHRPWSRFVDGCLLVNTGSVGRPKDGDPRGSYATVDLSHHPPRAEIVRVSYDVEAVAAAIPPAGLPPELATILRTGGSLD